MPKVAVSLKKPATVLVPAPLGRMRMPCSLLTPPAVAAQTNLPALSSLAAKTSATPAAVRVTVPKVALPR